MPHYYRGTYRIFITRPGSFFLFLNSFSLGKLSKSILRTNYCFVVPEYPSLVPSCITNGSDSLLQLSFEFLICSSGHHSLPRPHSRKFAGICRQVAAYHFFIDLSANRIAVRLLYRKVRIRFVVVAFAIQFTLKGMLGIGM